MSVKVNLKVTEKWSDNLEAEVQKYEKENREKGQIVFYGPSNFKRWDGREGGSNLNTDIVGASGKPCAINRGFGGSCSEHQLYYYPRLVRPLEPSVLVYFPFGNGTGLGYTMQEMWELAQRVIVYAMTDFPDMRIYLSGMGPRPNMTAENFARRDLLDYWLVEFAKKHENCRYVNVMAYEPFTKPEIRNRIFVADGVHFNHEGYELYADMWREVLKDELARF